MKLSAIKALLCAALFHACVAARAEVFIPMPMNTSLALGSGVNLLKPDEGLPSCFNFKPQLIDTGTREFKYSIDAVSSIEEVNKIRRKGASVGASYGGTSASLKSWQNSSFNDKKATLYVVIEARLVGPRMDAADIVPKPNRASLLEHGQPADIFRQCGTHVAMTEHRGQTLRVVVDMREADQATKQEVEARFSARSKMGLFKAKASASYSSSIARLAADKKLYVVVEGSGTPPQPDAIVALLKTKAGDLTAVAQALSSIMAGVGPDGASVGYGLTLQPIQLFAPAAFDVSNSAESVAALELLTDHMDLLKAHKAYLLDERNVDGLDQAYVKRLNDDLGKVNKLIADLRADTDRCLFSKRDAEKSCADYADDWKTRIRKSRDIRAAIKVSGDALVLDTELPLVAKGTLVAVIDNNELALDTLTFQKGRQTTLVAKARAAAAAAPAVPGAIPAARLSSTLPLTLNVGLMSAILPQLERESAMDQIYVGCFGVAFRSSNGPYGMALVELDRAILSPDSICKEAPEPYMAAMSTGYVPLGLAGTPPPPPPGLMPLAYEPLLVTAVSQPIQLKLILTDRLGLETAHLLSSDLRKTFEQAAGALKP